MTEEESQAQWEYWMRDTDPEPCERCRELEAENDKFKRGPWKENTNLRERIERAKAIIQAAYNRREMGIGAYRDALAALEGEMSNKGCRFHCGPDADGRCRDCDSYLPLEEQILISRQSVNRLGDRIKRAKAILRPAQLQKDNDRTWYWYRIDEALAALEGR